MGGTARSAQAVRACPRTLPDKGSAALAAASAPVCARQPSALSAQGKRPVVGTVSSDIDVDDAARAQGGERQDTSMPSATSCGMRHRWCQRCPSQKKRQWPKHEIEIEAPPNRIKLTSDHPEGDGHKSGASCERQRDNCVVLPSGILTSTLPMGW